MNKDGLKEALKVATAEQHDTQGASGIIGAVFCECREDAMIIRDAAQAHLETLEKREQWQEIEAMGVSVEDIKALVEARKAATGGEWERFHKGDTTDVHLKGGKEIVGWTGFDDTCLHSRKQHGHNAHFITTAANIIGGWGD